MVVRFADRNMRSPANHNGTGSIRPAAGRDGRRACTAPVAGCGGPPHEARPPRHRPDAALQRGVVLAEASAASHRAPRHVHWCVERLAKALMGTSILMGFGVSLAALGGAGLATPRSSFRTFRGGGGMRRLADERITDCASSGRWCGRLAV